MRKCSTHSVSLIFGLVALALAPTARGQHATASDAGYDGYSYYFCDAHAIVADSPYFYSSGFRVKATFDRQIKEGIKNAWDAYLQEEYEFKPFHREKTADAINRTSTKELKNGRQDIYEADCYSRVTKEAMYSFRNRYLSERRKHDWESVQTGWTYDGGEEVEEPQADP